MKLQRQKVRHVQCDQPVAWSVLCCRQSSTLIVLSFPEDVLVFLLNSLAHFPSFAAEKSNFFVFLMRNYKLSMLQ